MNRTARKRDPAFLQMAILAAIGGFLAIVLAIGLPIWDKLHGHPFMPAFTLFAGWGVAALAGCFACLQTYLLTDEPPRRPPRGGLSLTVTKIDAHSYAKAHQASDRRAA